MTKQQKITLSASRDIPFNKPVMPLAEIDGCVATRMRSLCEGNEALKRRGSLTIWFDPKMSWEAAPTGKLGRQQTYSDTAIQTCPKMKGLFGMALIHAGRRASIGAAGLSNLRLGSRRFRHRGRRLRWRENPGSRSV